MGTSNSKKEVQGASGNVAKSIFDFNVDSITGESISLTTYKGKKAYVVVNVASQ
jgi:hypothetical protein